MTDHTLQKKMIQNGAFLAGIAVALGAFGAHQLRDRIDELSMDAFQTAVRYQFFHAFAILFLGTLLRRIDPKYALTMYRLFFWGIMIFSGSLYVVSTQQLTYGDKILWVGGLTPIGGLFFLAGWGIFALKGYKLIDGTEKSRPVNNKTSDQKMKQSE